MTRPRRVRVACRHKQGTARGRAVESAAAARAKSALAWKETTGAAATARSQAAPQKLRTLHSPTVSNQGTANHRFRFLCRRRLVLESRDNEKRNEDHMGHNSWPQEQPNRCTAKADANQVEHSERAVRQHPIELLNGGGAGPAGDT